MEENKARVKRMRQEGKISAEQEKLLLKALEESEKRKERIFQETLLHRKRRQNKMWRVLFFWMIGVLFLVLVCIYSLQHNSNPSFNTQKALDYFTAAVISLDKGDYAQAMSYCKKGIDRAPGLALGYSLKGLTYKLMAEKTSDSSFKERGKILFQKAYRINERIKRRRTMHVIQIIFLSVLFIIIWGILSIILLVVYNALVRKEEGVNQAWGEVANYYQRKLDLIPALLEAVKDYATHEKATHEAVVKGRAKAQELADKITGLALTSKDKLKQLTAAESELSKGLHQLFALAEKYPDLKASENFLIMQKQLEDTENKMAQARTMYNRAVKVYNSALRAFPGNLVASLFKLEPKVYFEKEGGVA